MRILPLSLLALFVAAMCPLPASGAPWRAAVTEKVAALEGKNAAAFEGTDGWLFLTSELRFLAKERFWGEAAVSKSKRPAQDPLPAILDFHRQLKERGIELLLVPVPPKAAIYPEKVGVGAEVAPAETAPALREFYGVLRERGINVLDLSELFLRNRESARGPVFCRTDSHWSGVGCALAGEAIAQQIRALVPGLPPAKESTRVWKEISIAGDLAKLAHPSAPPVSETIAIRQLPAPAQAAPNSPVLLMGDSHTLVFHEFLAERAGLLDQLSAELGFAPDLIGTRGSGATAVRISLYRRARSDPQFLAQKKIVVWCFAAREFSEADQGWAVQPIAQ